VDVRPEGFGGGRRMDEDSGTTFEGETGECVDLVRAGRTGASAATPYCGRTDDCCFYMLGGGEGEGDFVAGAVGMCTLETNRHLVLHEVSKEWEDVLTGKRSHLLDIVPIIINLNFGHLFCLGFLPMEYLRIEQNIGTTSMDPVPSIAPFHPLLNSSSRTHVIRTCPMEHDVCFGSFFFENLAVFKSSVDNFDVGVGTGKGGASRGGAD
jgi:hypothetical protein